MTTGNYTLSVAVTTGEGLVADASSVTGTITVNAPSDPAKPTVTLATVSPITTGTNAVITVAAASAPSANVTITVTATKDGSKIGTPQTVDLTVSEFSMPATFSGLTAGLHTFSATVAPSGIVNATIASVDVVVNDPARPVVTLTTTTPIITADADAVITVAAASVPSADVTITVTATKRRIRNRHSSNRHVDNQ